MTTIYDSLFLSLWMIVLNFYLLPIQFYCIPNRVRSYLRSIIWYFHSCHIVLLNNKKIQGEFCVFLNEIFFAECDFLNLQRISSIKCSFILWNVVKSKFKKISPHVFMSMLLITRSGLQSYCLTHSLSHQRHDMQNNKHFLKYKIQEKESIYIFIFLLKSC